MKAIVINGIRYHIDDLFTLDVIAERRAAQIRAAANGADDAALVRPARTVKGWIVFERDDLNTPFSSINRLA